MKQQIPERKMCSRSQAGTLTSDESDTRLHPRTSNRRNFFEFLIILCNASSSINGWDVKPSTTPATLNSSRWGNPWEVACTFSNIHLPHTEQSKLYLCSYYQVLYPSSVYNSCMKRLQENSKPHNISCATNDNGAWMNVTWSLKETGESASWLLVSLSTLREGQPSCSLSMWMCAVVCATVLTLARSSTCRLGQWAYNSTS